MSGLPATLLSRPERWRPLPFHMAAIAFLMVVTGAAVLLLGQARTAIAREASGTLVVGIATPDRERREAAAAQVRAIAARDPDTVTTERLSDDAVRRLLGGGAMPAPAILDVRLKAGASPAALAARLSAIPDVRVQASIPALSPLGRLAAGLRWLALAGLALVGGLAAAAAMLVARATLVGEAMTLALLSGLGATDMQIARLIERRATREALAGALAGSAIAGATVLAAEARIGAALGSGMPLLRASDWGLLALLPLAISALVMVATRLAVLRQLRGSP